MSDPVSVARKKLPGYYETVGVDARMPDMVVDVPSVGKALLQHGEGLTTGMIRRKNSNSEIAVTVMRRAAPGDQYAAFGLTALIDKDEARRVGQGLIDMADGKMAPPQ